MDDIRGSAQTKIDENNPEVDVRKFRSIKNNYVRVLWYLNLALIPIFGILYILGIHQRVGINVYREQYIGLFLGLFLCALFLSIPASGRSPKDRVPWYDWILALLSLNAGGYLAVMYPSIVMKLGFVPMDRVILSIIAIILVLEAIRRSLGKVMLIIVLVFLSYGFFGSYLPGIFRASETSYKQLFNYLYLDGNSMLGMLNVAATIAIAFILLGQILLFFGGAEILNNFALAVFGGFRGGPAKGSIIASSLVGTITGGPVVNVILTGNVTIPLMKKNGYSSAEAGAVESVASTGGQIMPPVMGIAAFVIADFLGVRYAEVALAALVPAIMYYFCLFFQVDFIAGRKGLKALPKENLPLLSEVAKKGWMMLPILGSLIYFLFFKGVTPQTAGIYSSVIAIIFLALQKPIRQQMIKLFPKIFLETGRIMLEIGIVLAAAGIIVGVTGITGLGFNLGLILSSLAKYGLLFLLIASAIISVILGMGMPSVAAYSLVAVLIAPTLEQLGVDILAAHLFVFYFSIISNFTPPIALACFAASPIAKESPHKIGYKAVRLGIIAYVVPFLFIYAPELLLRIEHVVPLSETLLNLTTALFACFLLAMTLESFLFQKLNTVKRLFAAVLAVFLFLPASIWVYSWVTNLFAFVAAVLFIFIEWQNSKKLKALPGVNAGGVSQ